MNTASVAMPVSRKVPVDPATRSRGPSVQEIFAGDTNAPPACLLIDSPATDLGLDDVSIDRYLTKEWHEREIEKVWRRTWQIGRAHV